MRRALNACAAQQVLKGLHFEGRVQKVTGIGDVCLEDIKLPVGDEPYAWINRREWHGPLPHAGDAVSGVADIAGYTRLNGSCDLSLGNARMLQVTL